MIAALIRDILIVTVWVLAIGQLVQGAIHLVTWWVIHAQDSRTGVGVALSRRELTLGLKALCRTVFDGLLVATVTFGVDFEGDRGMLSPFFVVLTLATLAALYYGVRYLLALRRENWGQASAVSTFSEDVAETIDATASDVSEVKADVKDIQRRMDGP